MTTWTEKVLAEGQLPNTKTTLYTATGVRVNVKFIRADNVSGGAGNRVKFYYKKATSRRIINVLLDADGAVESDNIWQMDVGDQIEGEATVGASVDYIITGVTVA